MCGLTQHRLGNRRRRRDSGRCCLKPKITSCRSTPICGAARPAPLHRAHGLEHVGRRACATRCVPKRSTGGATRSSRGSPIFRMAWIGHEDASGCQVHRFAFSARAGSDHIVPAPAPARSTRLRAGNRKLVVRLRMQEAHVVAGRAGADAAGREAHATFALEPGDGGAQDRRSTGRCDSAASPARPACRRGSIGCIRSISTRLARRGRSLQMSSSTFSRSERKLPLGDQAEHVDPERAQPCSSAARRWPPAARPRTCERPRCLPLLMPPPPSLSNSRMTSIDGDALARRCATIFARPRHPARR